MLLIQLLLYNPVIKGICCCANFLHGIIKINKKGREVVSMDIELYILNEQLTANVVRPNLLKFHL